MAFITAPLYISLPIMALGFGVMVWGMRVLGKAEKSDKEARYMIYACRIMAGLFLGIAAASIAEKIL